jgi:hypothetical protein
MVGNGSGQAIRKVGVPGMEGQERQDRSVEVLDVAGLGLITAASIGCLAPGVPFGGPLRFEFSSNPFDGGCRCPHAREKTFRPFFS